MTLEAYKPKLTVESKSIIAPQKVPLADLTSVEKQLWHMNKLHSYQLCWSTLMFGLGNLILATECFDTEHHS